MALSNAERQRRWRERQRTSNPPPRTRARRDRRTRHQQWRDAIATIITLRDGWQTWRDDMPENLTASPTAERLDEVLERLEDVDWEHLAALDLPRGFGRDV